MIPPLAIAVMAFREGGHALATDERGDRSSLDVTGEGGGPRESKNGVAMRRNRVGFVSV